MRDKGEALLLIMVMLGVSIALTGGPSYAQVREAWVARYNGSGNGRDLATALAVDGQGNLYVTGSAWGGGTFTDYVTIKYDTDGNPLWVASYNGVGNLTDNAHAVKVDSQGSVYVTGESWGAGTRYDYATVKYDTNGNLLWVARYNGEVNGDDYALALAVDGQGSVYVTGRSYGGSNADYDYATVKYDANGNQLWVARYNGTGSGFDEAAAVAVDGEGNVYVAGYTLGLGTGADYTTIKYDRNGNQLWVASYNGPGNREDYIHALAVDHLGNAYVTGRSHGGSTSIDYATIKYDANGHSLWVARYNGPLGDGGDIANALAVDSQGYVYVTGRSWGADNPYDYATIKYDPNGNPLWIARYNGPGNGADSAQALVLDSQSNVYVTGYSWGSNTLTDYATLKYDTAGNLLWVARYNGPGNDRDEAFALVVDSRGNVYVTGHSWGSGTSEDYATIKYTQPPQGDVNGDGCVNDQDLSAVLQKYGQSCQGCGEDLNGDGVVNDSDLALVLRDYGQGC